MIRHLNGLGRLFGITLWVTALLVACSTHQGPDQSGVEITDMTPKIGPEGTPVSITGQNFSATASDNTVTFNGTQAAVSSASTTQLVASVPSGATTGQVKVKVGSQTATGPTFTVTVNHPPQFTSGQTAYSVAENTTAVTTLVATDPDGDTVTYSLNGGEDQALFAITPSSGALRFKSAPDFENPADADANNIYKVQVQAGDGTASASQDLTITVTDVNDAPTITSLSPTSGPPTTTVTITGTHFSATAADNTVSFNGTQATVTSASATQLKATVPGGATTGPVKVTTEFQTATSTSTFTVIPFAGGAGTQTDPYQVATLTQLQAVGQYVDKYFEQTQDIDASPTTNASYGDGKGFTPIGNISTAFTGHYDGGGHTISGLTINRPNTDYAGLFGVVGSGGAVTDAGLNGTDITGSKLTGGLAGQNAGSITGSYVNGSVTSVSQTGGGLVGVNYGSIAGSYATVNVSGSNVGGLAGRNRGTITNSNATGSVTGSNSSNNGGLVGFNPDGTITGSYATGSITGGNIGGLVGANGSGSITNSYWDKTTTGQTTSAGSPNTAGLTTAQMQGTAAPTNMAGFDFTTVWQVVTNPDGYPVLR